MANYKFITNKRTHPTWVAFHLGGSTAAACHFICQSLRKVTQQDKKIDSYLILKRGTPAPRYICDMSPKKRAVWSTFRKTWGPKKTTRPKKSAGPPESVDPWNLPRVPPPPLIRPWVYICVSINETWKSSNNFRGLFRKFNWTINHKEATSYRIHYDISN